MANYVAHYRKKLQTLARNKLALVRLLEQRATDGQIAAAAEEVRASQIRALEAKRAQIAPSELNCERIQKLEAEISHYRGVPVAEIIAWCRPRHPKSSTE